ncbi:MAG TPA: hypothetical protein VM686_02945, partial [Polyangiaceae bacterium]|nr:hypothetical protein [Polyangiaceae bacterium]
MRLGVGLFAVSLLAFACDSVLGISEPEPRSEGDAGAGSSPVEDGGQAGDAGNAGNMAGGASAGTGTTHTEPAAAGQGGGGQGGGSGAGGAPSCALGETRCGGADNKTPETCGAMG